MGYSSAQAKEFIKHIAPMIQGEAKQRGYKICSTVIAQAIIEGAAGTSVLAKTYHNHFGMKCGKSWKGGSVNMKTKEEYTQGNLTTIKDNFRTYASDEAGVSGYYDFISAPRYENLKTATTYKEYAERLKLDGYATSSSYVNTLCNTVVKYNLAVYDEASDIPQHIQKRRVLKFVLPFMVGSDVVLCQTILRNNGYDIGYYGVDGKYGKQTETAVKKFQEEHGLVVDGKVGVKTWAMLEKYNEN